MTLEEMRRIKEERGYSLFQISNYTGIPVVTLQKVFSGQSKCPRKTTIDRIEKVLLGDEEIYPGRSHVYRMNTESKGIYDELSHTEPNMVKDSVPVYIKTPGEFTVEDYYSLPEDTRVELIDGVFYNMTAPNIVHQDIASFIHMSIYNFIRKNKGACKVFEAPVDVQLDCDNKTMFQPDVMIICDRDKIKVDKIFGAPDFILEILSPSTRRKDKTIKLSKYENAGVKEYWIIDPMQKILITYNFMEEDWFPVVVPLKGTAKMAIFEGKLEIDLDEIMESIEEFGGNEG
ncbi:MAG: Uma2 family endonuclease [Eubacteriales bacterium]|nr:Uma2 family endonuclease [Eubacteriales bacterium]